MSSRVDNAADGTEPQAERWPWFKRWAQAYPLLSRAAVCTATFTLWMSLSTGFRMLPEALRLTGFTLFVALFALGVIACIGEGWHNRSAIGGRLMLAFMILVGLPLMALCCFVTVMEWMLYLRP